MKTVDERIFREFVEQHIAYVYTVALKISGSRDDADEITQETFIKAWRSFIKFDQSRPPRPWLHEIAKNTAYDFLRQRRSTSISIDQAQAVYDATMIHDLHVSFDSARVAALLQCSSTIVQQIFQLRYFEDLCFREIADRLQMSIHTVTSLHRRAVHRLRSLHKN